MIVGTDAEEVGLKVELKRVVQEARKVGGLVDNVFHSEVIGFEAVELR